MMLGEGLFANGRSEYDKEPGTGTTEAKVLITVKAAPQPSANHGDTVCVAGLRTTTVARNGSVFTRSRSDILKPMQSSRSTT